MAVSQNINKRQIDSSTTRPSLDAYRQLFGGIPANQNKPEAVLKNHFEGCVRRAAEQLQKHPFWIELKQEVENWDASYRLLTPNVEALYSGSFEQQADLNCKKWESAFNKAYRKNVLKNKNWPNPPDEGFVTAESWFEKLGDILRTTLTSRYIDGVQFIAERLVELAHKHGLNVNNQLQATPEGYYAGHVDIEFDFVIEDLMRNDVTAKVSVEFQVTTQLKQVVKELLHVFYESDRLKTDVDKSSEVWQWDYRKPLFDANYLGHVVHYLEAQILKVREKNHGN